MTIALDGRRRVFFVCGMALIAFGAFSIITDSRSSGVAASLFTIAGMVISYLQLFIAAPQESPGRRPGGGDAGAPAGAVRQAPPAAARPAATRPSPVPAASFFLAALLIAASYIIGLQGIGDIHQFRADSVLSLLGCLIAIFAYTGFCASQSAAAPQLATVATAVTITSLTLNVIENFLLLVSSDPGQPFPSAVITLFHYNLYLIMAADVLIAATVLRVGVFPRWTAWMCFAVAGSALLLLWFPHSRTAGVLGDLTGLGLCLAYAAFGMRLARGAKST